MSALTISIDFQDVPADQATIPILDHGFLFGDSVYEVVRTWRGRLLFAVEHMERLVNSAAGISLPLPHPVEAYIEEMQRLHTSSGNAESYVRLIVTRGTGELELATQSCTSQRSIMICKRLHQWDPAMYTDGAHVVLASVIRNSRRSTNPAFKTGNYLNNVMAIDEAKAVGATEALMLNASGEVTEGTTSNVFMVKNGKVLTPKLEVGILGGITRAKVLAICPELGIEFAEQAFGEHELRSADEMFITSTTRDVMPITKLDDKPVGNGLVGPVTQRLMDAYRNLCNASIGMA